MLHIVNKSPLERNSLAACVRVARSGALLLIEDGVYAATRGNAGAALLREAVRLKLYALAPDLQARGVAERVIDGVELVDYAGFVELVAAYPRVQSWL